MIAFHSTFGFALTQEKKHQTWIEKVINARGFKVGNLSYVFCEDAYLLKINKDFLNHDTYTDIISFDESHRGTIAGEIYISIERVKENAIKYAVAFEEELRRVMIHGVLHFLGEKDKTPAEQAMMRQRESEAMRLFHVEQL